VSTNAAALQTGAANSNLSPAQLAAVRNALATERRVLPQRSAPERPRGEPGAAARRHVARPAGRAQSNP
jgi:hypothetical protein